MKVRVDHDLCTGSGICIMLAPANFVLNDDGQADIENSQDADEGVVRDAAAACPNMAIVVSDE